jgi:eukaryotic-like serine/threonine-protein kinase
MVTTGEAVAGRVLGGRYALGPALGVGASATVHEAIDTTLGRRVAVKVLHPALAADESFLRRFRAEARAAAALSHPNILRVYDWGEGPDQPWLVTELMTGGSLRELLDRGHRLTPAQARRLGAEAASGLEHAHRRGLVHRDIKPANLLFDDDGRVVIADFGLARALAEAGVTESSGAILGTAKYAAPEQARGLSVDGRADVYALALVLVESITGRVPFTADTTIATLMARVGKDLDPPAELGPLSTAVARAGRSLVDSRSDAGRFASDLATVAGDVGRADPLPISGTRNPVPAPPASALDRTEHGRTEPPAPRMTRRRSRDLLFKILIPLVVTALMATGIVASGVLVPSRVVPGVTGDSESRAITEIRAAGLQAEVSRRVYEDGTEPGEVLDQDPPRGQHRKANRPVLLTVSRGPTPVGVPDLAGRTQSEAEAALEGAGLLLGAITTEHNPNPKGTVIHWDPRDVEAPKGSKVNLVLSDGPPPVPVPDFEGDPVDQVVAKLKELGLEPVRRKVFSDDVEVGRVVGTSPAAGQPAPHGSQVEVRESQGPETVTVPDVTGNSVEEATAQLERAGLKVGEIYGRQKRGRVAETDPGAGAKVRRGTSVALFVV